jgi:GNAT superfamily N-acetyltransferase
MADIPPRWTVVEISATDTHSVRRAVLRADTPTKEVSFPEDTWPGAVHLGVHDGASLIATSSWIPRESPDRPRVAAAQLRGMATLTSYQGRGVGSALVRAGIDWARRHDADFVWANARDAALAFYLREGFTVVSDGFIDATTQLPHHRVAISVASSTAGSVAG